MVLATEWKRLEIQLSIIENNKLYICFTIKLLSIILKFLSQELASEEEIWYYNTTIQDKGC
ncbi:MAG: hypothetical protein A2X49_11575 [Lentisphaerae bacterium GWF2_52_8]|nr:MAG: hypothetical protein A2X49_11575 [Lentisphaerae bacterium GWF2_52_8]